MHYYRVIEGPAPLTHKGQTVEYITILPESVGIEERNAPVVGCEDDLTNQQKLDLKKMMSGIYVHFDDKTYEYRTQLQKKDEEGNLVHIVLEVGNGF